MARKSSFDGGQLTDIAFYILASLQEEKHGYLIMEIIKTSTCGEFIIVPASMYTTLKKLVQHGYIYQNCILEKNKIKYQITDLGKQLLSIDIKRKEDMINFAKNAINFEGSSHEK